MARLRILELPLQVLGEYTTTPFAVIIDQVETRYDTANDDPEPPLVAELTQDGADHIAHQLGAVAAVVLAGTIDLD